MKETFTALLASWGSWVRMWKGFVNGAKQEITMDTCTHTLSLMSPGCSGPSADFSANEASKGLGLERFPWAVFRQMSAAQGRRKWPGLDIPQGWHVWRQVIRREAPWGKGQRCVWRESRASVWGHERGEELYPMQGTIWWGILKHVTISLSVLWSQFGQTSLKHEFALFTTEV